MNKKIFIAIVTSINMLMFFACNQSAKKVSTEENKVSTEELTPKKPSWEELTSKYNRVYDLKDNFALVYIGEIRGNSPGGAGGKFGFVDKTGVEVVPCKYDYAIDFKGGMAAVSNGGAFQLEETNIGGTNYSLYHYRGGKWGFIDKTGKEVTPIQYDAVNDFFEGLASVRMNGKSGYVDNTGQEVIPLKYDFAGNFSEGKAIVRVKGKEGFIDKTGESLAPPTVHSFVEYSGKKTVDNGMTLNISFTLETKGDEKTIRDYKIHVGKETYHPTFGKGTMTNYENSGVSISVAANGMFSAGDFRGTVKTNKVDCTLKRSYGATYTFTAFPKK